MSKLNQEGFKQAIADIKTFSEEKKRNFVETIELQIGLKDYDTQKDKRFNGTVRLPNVARPRLRICVFGDAAHCEEAQAAGIPFYDIEGLKKFQKNKKEIRKLIKSYDAFLASAVLIPQIPKLLGPGFNRAGKFPQILQHTDKMVDKCAELKATVRFQLKKVLCMGCAISTVGASEEEIRQNATLAINFLVSLLKKNWNNVKVLYIKSTMGKPQRIYG
eukprot:GHVP01031851.1.p1 GENE.GHVP01031851.1~~GHVP01031851.1.p1  ORF type:complete len:218 (+),score=29.13 GHVP01031851.1:65-718(+)